MDPEFHYCILSSMLTVTKTEHIEQLQFLTPKQAQDIAQNSGTPVFVYHEATLIDRAHKALSFKAPFGLTVRYAMKANPLAAILRIFNSLQIHIDASSGFEAHRAISSGIPADHIMITSQQLPDDLKELVELGVLFNATSIHQLETYGKLFPGTPVSVRINPSIGSGHNRKVETGGPTSSFGIWFEDIAKCQKIASRYMLTINKIHTHIGAGSDPKIWHEAARLTLELVEHFPDVTTLNLGGGLKVARISSESDTNIEAVSQPISDLLLNFERQTKRKLHLEIEPGTYLVTNACSLISKVIDQTQTGISGYSFLKLNIGLTEIMRPSLYAAQHSIIVVNDQPRMPRDYVVVGHTCESGDLLTTDILQPDVPSARTLQTANIGDVVVIEGVGSYCSTMCAKGYNSFPECPEVLLTVTGDVTLVKRQRPLADQISYEL